MSLVGGLFIAWLFCLGWLWRNARKHPPLPPGPPADPLIGHLRVVPSDGQEMFFYELGRKYGGVVHLHFPGRSVIVLNSVRAATELLDKRGSNYSDRPKFVIYHMMGFFHNLVLLRYGREFQIQRKMFKEYLGRKTCTEYHPIQTREAHALVQNLLSNPEGHDEHFMRFSTAIITDITYGHKIMSDNDPFLKIMQGASHMLATSGPPGGTPVDMLPILRYFPSWFPGTYYRDRAWNSRNIVRQLYQYPFGEVEKQMANGTAKRSIVASHLETLVREGSNHDDSVELIQGVSTVIYFAGAETTASTLDIFTLAMVLYPEYQAAAQKEIDTVIGPDRLPEFNDRDSLPYLECILQETLRWHQAVPMGVPHRSLDDDIYNGMFIPKGSIIIANTRGMTLDEDVYENPFQFDPSRYLPKPRGRGEPYPTAAFGFGRRICPGRYLALDNVWIAMATILTTLSIGKALGYDGKEEMPEVSFITSVTNHLRPFRCSIQSRSKKAESLISQMDISDVY